MKKILTRIGILAGLAILAVIVIVALLPWMDRWGATHDEISASFSGDELVPAPRVTYTRAVSIHAAPEEVFPWIVQLGAERGGMYSYSWFETNVLRCELINAERIHEEWQGLQVGDQVKMCPGENWGPPAYEVAILEPDHAIVLGHQENGTWGDVWQFILVPQEDRTTRLVLRSRDMKSGGIWDVMRPGEFIMVRGMLLGIKERAEHLAETGGMPGTSPTQQTSWQAFGENISLSYDTHWMVSAEAVTLPAVPMSDQSLFSGSHPAYAQIRFSGFDDAGSYELPIDPVENSVPQVMVFQTMDFSGYGDNSSQGFMNQLQSLTAILKKGVNSDRCSKPLPGDDPGLPFLPWINLKQSFCAQPQVLIFAGGKGIRYLSHYAQGPSPVLEGEIFYTFQGVTDDGQFYISALFPVQTGIFPHEPSPCPMCSDPNYNPLTAWRMQVTEQVSQLNTRSESDFAPPLKTLDEVLKSIRIGP